MNIKLFIANIVVIGLVAGFFWLRHQHGKRSETRRANGQMRLLGPTDELSELTQVVREWADNAGVLNDRPDVLPDFGSADGDTQATDSNGDSDAEDDAGDSDDRSPGKGRRGRNKKDKEKVS